MQILNYFRKIKRNFDLKNIKSEIDNVRDELVNQALPTVTEASKSFDESKDALRSKTYQLYYEALNGVQPIARNQSALSAVVDRLQRCDTLLDYISEIVDNEFTETMNAETVTLKGSYVFRLLNLIELYTRFSVRMTEVILISENNLAENKMEHDSIAPISLAFLERNKESFLQCHRLLINTPDHLRDQLNDVPDIVLSEVRSPSMLSMHGKGRIDPLQMGFAESRADIFWLWAVNRAEYQANRYATLKEDCRLLELLIERRKRALKGDGTDIQLQKVIAKREAQLDIKRAKLAKIEKIYD